MNKVLVTGAAGFIASQVATILLSRGVEVIGIDNMNDYYDVRLKEWRLELLKKQKNFTFHKIDIEDLNAVESLFSKHSFDVIFNLAARAGVRASMENPHVYLGTNSHGALNLLEQIKSGKTKYILASTSSLYSGQKMPFLESLPVNTPISPYAASKKAAELMAYSYHHLYGIDVSIVRYFTVYGPAGRPDMSIYRFVKWIDMGEKMEVFGDGAQSRDFTFVEDVAEGTVLASKKLGYEIINIGGGNRPIPINTVISMIEKTLGKKAIVDNKVFHKADILETWADISKAGSLLDWKPKVSFEEGIQRTIQWYKDNKDFVSQLKM